MSDSHQGIWVCNIQCVDQKTLSDVHLNLRSSTHLNLIWTKPSPCKSQLHSSLTRTGYYTLINEQIISFEKGPSSPDLRAPPLRESNASSATKVSPLTCIVVLNWYPARHLQSALGANRSRIFDQYFVGSFQKCKINPFPPLAPNRCFCHHVASSPNGWEDDRSCQKKTSPSEMEAQVTLKRIFSSKHLFNMWNNWSIAWHTQRACDSFLVLFLSRSLFQLNSKYKVSFRDQ